MNKYLRFFKMEFVKTIKMYPKMLIIAILILSIIIGIGYVGAKSFQDSEDDVTITVAVVKDEEDTNTTIAMMYISKVTTAKHFKFKTVDKDTGMEMLNNGQAAAMIYVTKDTVDGILNGNNVPMKIYFPQNAGVESSILQEFINPATKMLQVAQSQIYSAYDVCYEYDKTREEINRYQDDINEYNLDFALNRLKLFKNANLSKVDGNFTMIQYYTISGIMLFILLFGMTLYPIMSNYNKSFTNQAKRIGIGNEIIGINKGIISYITYFVTMLILYILISQFTNKIGLELTLHTNFVISLLIILLFSTTFIQFIYSLSNENVGSILMIFFASVIMTYISGGFIPSIYLSKTVQDLAVLMPTTYIMRALMSLYTYEINVNAIQTLLMFSGLFFLLTIISKKVVARK